MAAVASSYPDLTATFADDLSQLLLKNHASLDADLRAKIVQSLVLLRNKDIITSSALLQTLFPVLTATTSKQLRGQIYKCVVSDLKNSNNKVKNHKLNKTVQAVLFELVEAGKEDPTSTSGLWAVKLTRELWKRGVWDDARTVEIMKEASLSANQKVMSGGIRFFLGVDQEKADFEEESEDEGPDLGRVKHQLQINKKKRNQHRKLEKAQEALKKVAFSIHIVPDCSSIRAGGQFTRQQVDRFFACLAHCGQPAMAWIEMAHAQSSESPFRVVHTPLTNAHLWRTIVETLRFYSRV
jgi:protein SDA1